MRLLILTQTVNKDDSVLGFFHRWLVEFAQECEQVTVIALGVYHYDLPSNVTVVSLGKERRANRFFYIVNLLRYLWRYRGQTDAVLVHMNPIYLVLAGWWFRWRRYTVGLWYTHRQVDTKLRLAVPFCDHIFTAAPESFNLKTDKLRVVGHGIETARFTCAFPADLTKSITITHVGRLTPIKNCDTLIEATAKLKSRLTKSFQVVFIGAPAVDADHDYAAGLKKLVADNLLDQTIVFAGNIKNSELPQHLCASTVTVNLTPTGGIDKSVLESMASGRPVLVSNEAFRSIFGPYANDLIFNYRDPADLALKLEKIITGNKYQEIAQFLHQKAVDSYDVAKVVKTIVECLNSPNYSG